MPSMNTAARPARMSLRSTGRSTLCVFPVPVAPTTHVCVSLARVDEPERAGASSRSPHEPGPRLIALLPPLVEPAQATRSAAGGRSRRAGVLSPSATTNTGTQSGPPKTTTRANRSAQPTTGDQRRAQQECERVALGWGALARPPAPPRRGRRKASRSSADEADREPRTRSGGRLGYPRGGQAGDERSRRGEQMPASGPGRRGRRAGERQGSTGGARSTTRRAAARRRTRRSQRQRPMRGAPAQPQGITVRSRRSQVPARGRTGWMSVHHDLPVRECAARVVKRNRLRSGGRAPQSSVFASAAGSTVVEQVRELRLLAST